MFGIIRAVPTYGAGIATSYSMLKLFPFWDPLHAAYLHIMAGCVLTTLWVGAVTGLVKS